ncbi:hypothetical protein AB434_0766 [Heyndrickxia coagulans]|uniref:Uncharacterized protein n=1 Tax=Heyndrickxia coagulans TaxID=1398 RepID=A0AAN0T3T3_HEYCO|nr:hypothetical protein SB48_HM08orf00613 [Heyndrickxia coagulans]AKN53171.1 hypothetical protein AB434_0766 [Heyndrickxia coagulans]KYC64341.1 hypothetical protein B4100_1752 [Heyndrickxia coagulans]
MTTENFLSDIIDLSLKKTLSLLHDHYLTKKKLFNKMKLFKK